MQYFYCNSTFYQISKAKFNLTTKGSPTLITNALKLDSDFLTLVTLEQTNAKLSLIKSGTTLVLKGEFSVDVLTPEGEVDDTVDPQIFKTSAELALVKQPLIPVITLMGGNNAIIGTNVIPFLD